MNNNIRLVRIIFGKDKIQIIESTKIWGGSWEKTTTNELSVAKVFHKVLNKGRVEEIFEKSDYEVLGKMLYEILTANSEMKEFFESLIDRSTKSDEIRYKVMMQFEDDTHELAGLPWEYLLVPVRSKNTYFYLSAGDRMQFDVIRDFDLRSYQSTNLVMQSKQLKVIWIFVEARRHRNEPKLDYSKCEQVFETLKIRNRINSENTDFERFSYYKIKNPTIDSLKKEIKDILELFEGPYVIHFLGHAEMRKNQGAFIGLASGGDMVEWVRDTVFVDLFKIGANAFRLPDMVVLQACESAQINEKGEGLGIGLVKQGIPIVIGMQNEITLDVSLAFIREFYTNIMKGEDVAYAVTQSRYYLGCKYPDDDSNPENHYGSNAFGTPVLFSCVGEERIQFIEQSHLAKPQQGNYKICQACSKKYKGDFTSEYCVLSNCNGTLVEVAVADDTSTSTNRPNEAALIRTPKSSVTQPENARLNEAEKIRNT